MTFIRTNRVLHANGLAEKKAVQYLKAQWGNHQGFDLEQQLTTSSSWQGQWQLQQLFVLTTAK
jgi:hypothetical protein